MRKWRYVRVECSNKTQLKKLLTSHFYFSIPVEIFLYIKQLTNGIDKSTVNNNSGDVDREETTHWRNHNNFILLQSECGVCTYFSWLASTKCDQSSIYDMRQINYVCLYIYILHKQMFFVFGIVSARNFLSYSHISTQK